MRISNKALPILFLSTTCFAQELPNQRLTPGVIFERATVQEICTFGYSHSIRHVTGAEKRFVYREYHKQKGPNCCEIDHLVPLELGGSNDIRNLWPQPWDEARTKDQLETYLHDEVCAGTIGLQFAQDCIAVDWVRCMQQQTGTKQ